MLPGPLSLVKRSFFLFRKKFRALMMLGLIATLVSIVQVLAIQFHSLLLFFVSLIATIVVTYITYLAMIRVATDPGHMSAGESLSRIESFVLPAAWVSLVIILMTLGGALVFVIFAFIISLYTMFAVFAVIVDHHEKHDAVVYSWHLVTDRWWALFYRLVVANILIGLATLVILAICWVAGIGESPAQTIARVHVGWHSVALSEALLEQIVTNLFSLPLTICFLAVVYEALKKEKPHMPTGEKAEEIKKYIKVAAALGMLFIILGFFISGLYLAKALPEAIRLTHTPAAVFSAF